MYWIIKNIFLKFEFHVLYWVMTFIAFLTGYFKDLLVFTSIIIIHELGHVLMSLFYHWKIKKILILPLGGITIFEDIIDKPLKQEIMVALMGPLFQIILTIIVNIFSSNSTFNYYSFCILIFNLIPIFPLDGSKMLNILFNKVFPFKLSYYLTLDFSFIIVLLFLFLANSLTMYLGIGFLFYNLIREYKNINITFKTFLLERVLYHIKYTKKRVIKGLNVNRMYRNYSHFFEINNNKYSENFIIVKMFDFTRLL